MDVFLQKLIPNFLQEPFVFYTDKTYVDIAAVGKVVLYWASVAGIRSLRLKESSRFEAGPLHSKIVLEAGPLSFIFYGNVSVWLAKYAAYAVANITDLHLDMEITE